MRVYLDNAATTPLDPEVFETMKPFMLEDFGNPSSTHAHGRKVRAAIESARKKIAELVNCTPGEIIFTSGGTEADNAIIRCAIETYNIKHAISTPIEHHAVTHTLETLEKQGIIALHYVKLDAQGSVDLIHLEELLKTYPNALVSLMHANNEIGNLLDIEAVGNLCEQYGAYFHSDTVQTMGHYRHDLKKLNVHGMTAAAHKFHGPKGVGFMYINKDKKIKQFVHGGAQERNMRGGTENVYGIIGLAKALEICYREMDEHQAYITSLKKKMIEQLKASIPGVSFNGNSGDLSKSLYTVLNVSLPENEENEMLLFNLDMQGISASGGSACSSGASTGSHVLGAIYPNSKRGAIRLSFSKYNKPEEIDFVVSTIAEIYKVTVPN
ncbi:MAG TPA: cysteine desulfurase family protein [Cyclobacteriaceae bacterium]|jgi:cysteine desulfurase|nr:cysteine desulfurase [Cytophagales bacterium]HNT51246.1 cysteine desulfurase family protein [Cyclobacteriaceae bacterium]HRE67635.1 cysteine desulfurase family protein [Cyclobacteriaceae bacterium]HRF33788.1 cysteine desulfurase family protein [Cyclobacteriaceae bacterium]